MSVPVLRPEDLRKISDDIEMAKVHEALSRKQKEEEEQRQTASRPSCRKTSRPT